MTGGESVTPAKGVALSAFLVNDLLKEKCMKR